MLLTWQTQIYTHDILSYNGYLHILRSSSRAQAKRLVAIWDAAGRLRVQRDNGTIRYQATTNHTHLASSASACVRVCVVLRIHACLCARCVLHFCVGPRGIAIGSDMCARLTRQEPVFSVRFLVASLST